MTHDQLQELVFLSHDRELGPADQALVESHLKVCAECRGALASWAKTSSLIFNPSKIEAPESFIRHVMRRIETERTEQPSLSAKWRTFVEGLAAALTPRRLVLAGTATMAMAAMLVFHPFKASPPTHEAAIEYASDLMEGPFAYAETENDEADNHTPIETYFL